MTSFELATLAMSVLSSMGSGILGLLCWFLKDALAELRRRVVLLEAQDGEKTEAIARLEASLSHMSRTLDDVRNDVRELLKRGRDNQVLAPKQGIMAVNASKTFKFAFDIEQDRDARTNTNLPALSVTNE